MPNIDFYILSETQLNAQFHFACRLIEKAYKKQHRIYIHTETKNDAHLMDELLWTYRDDSFLPHNLLGEGPDPSPPIQIGFEVQPEKHRDILINLSQKVPEFFKQFNRVLECVGQDTQQQSLARDRFRTYQAHGFKINTHKL